MPGRAANGSESGNGAPHPAAGLAADRPSAARGPVPRAAGSEREGGKQDGRGARQRTAAGRMWPAPGAPAALGTHGPPGSQRGAALIALVLALALGSGLVTIEWLEAAAPFRPRRASHRGRARGRPRRAHRIRRVLSGPALRPARAGLPPMPRHERQRLAEHPLCPEVARAAAVAPAGPARSARRRGGAALVRARRQLPGQRLQAPAAQPRDRGGARAGWTDRGSRGDRGARAAAPVSGPGARSLRSRPVPGRRKRDPARCGLHHAGVAPPRPAQRSIASTTGWSRSRATT